MALLSMKSQFAIQHAAKSQRAGAESEHAAYASTSTLASASTPTHHPIR
jgi:hypothetical protein